MNSVTVNNIRNDYPSHPYHLTLESPWPILTSGAVLSIMTSGVIWFHNIEHSGLIISLGIISVVTAATLWWSDVTVEGTYLGLHTRIVQQTLSIGVSLFIVTEALFFLSIFWAY